MAIFCVLVVLAIATSGNCLVPSDVPWLRYVLTDCRLLCNGLSYGAPDLIGVEIKDRFFMNNQGQLVQAENRGGNERCELRNDYNWHPEGPEHRMTATMKLDWSTESQSAVTFMQIHAKDDPNFDEGPFLRMVWEKEERGVQNHLWAKLRTNYALGDKKRVTLDLGVRPTGFFKSEVRVVGNMLFISINDVVKVDRNIDYFAPALVYFKTGVYHHGPTGLNNLAAALYKSLEIVVPQPDVGCPPGVDYCLVHYPNNDRTSPKQLHNLAVQDTLHASLVSQHKIRTIHKVIFSLAGETLREGKRPFDFDFDVSKLPNGVHTLRASLDTIDGPIVVEANFIVGSSDAAGCASDFCVGYSTDTDRTSYGPLHQSRIKRSSNMFVFLVSVEKMATVQRVRFVIQGQYEKTEKRGPWDLAGGSSSTPNPYPVSNLPVGKHTLITTITTNSGEVVQLQDVFDVVN